MKLRLPSTVPFKGIIAAAVTPITHDLRIDTSQFVTHCRDLVGRGCTRISTFGTTGEGVAFTAAEKRAAHKALLAAGLGPQQILPAVMNNSVRGAAEEVADAAAMGCDKVLVLPPCYYPNPSVEGLASFYQAVFEHAGRPRLGFVLYNIPAMSGVTVTLDLIERLRASLGATIAGVKDSTGDIESGLAYVSALPDLAIFTGDDRVLLELLRAGGAGMIGGLPNLYADDLVALFNNVEGPDAERLSDLAAQRIAQIDDTGGLLALKAAVASRHRDDNWRRVMPPLAALANSTGAIHG